MKKEVMTRAWEIARKAASPFGGKPSEYIRGTVKMAWNAIKEEREEQETYGLKKWQAVEAKMRKAGKYTMADLLGQAKEVKFNEVMHKEGAYYGIEVITEFGKLGTYYIAEKAWA